MRFINNEEFKRPKAPIIGADGNVFNLMGICSRELKHAGYPEKATEMNNRIMSCGSYDEALDIMQEYVDPVDQYYNELEDIDYDMNDIEI